MWTPRADDGSGWRVRMTCAHTCEHRHEYEHRTVLLSALFFKYIWPTARSHSYISTIHVFLSRNIFDCITYNRRVRCEATSTTKTTKLEMSPAHIIAFAFFSDVLLRKVFNWTTQYGLHSQTCECASVIGAIDYLQLKWFFRNNAHFE